MGSTHRGAAVRAVYWRVILRARCPDARIVALILPDILAPATLAEAADTIASPVGLVDRTSSSFVEALQISVDWQVLAKGRGDGF